MLILSLMMIYLLTNIKCLAENDEKVEEKSKP